MIKPIDDLDPPTIVWFRSDLRVADNPALASAAAGGHPVIPVYVFDDSAEKRPLGAAAQWWLHGSLGALGEALAARGSRLILRRGDASAIIAAMARETGADRVLWNRRYDPAGVRRDAALEAQLDAGGVEVSTHNAALLNEPWEVLTQDGRPYKVFTPYWRAARARLEGAPGPVRAPARLAAPAHWPASDPLDGWGLRPRHPDWAAGFDWIPGEAAAHARLDRFVEDDLADYEHGRDRPAEDGSSRLSPHLRWGEIGPRQILHRLRLAEHHGASNGQGEAFLRELGWREFNHQLLFHETDLARRNLRPDFDAMAWRDDEAGVEAWRLGRTGYPMVDAAMRQLWTTGWMHNRARMIAASFLVKDLLIDWRVGEAWFWDTLVDADPANNPANWQWAAGSGADAQPFFRIFNPTAQGERFDLGGGYIRRWLPELAGLPDDLVHAPWEAGAAALKAAGVELGRTYPAPILDHKAARERALGAYRATRMGAAD